MNILRQQHFNVDFFEFEANSTKYRVGLGNYRNREAGCEMFYPESGTDYMLVIFDNGWYQFDVSEFTHSASIGYISEKLKCSIVDAKNIHSFISDILNADAALELLNDNVAFKNPYLKGITCVM